MAATESSRRNWDWDENGELLGHYVDTSRVNVKSGPSAGQSKLVFEFHVGLEDESVSVWGKRASLEVHRGVEATRKTRL